MGFNDLTRNSVVVIWRFAVVVAVFAILAGLAACGGDDGEGADATVQPASTATSAPPTGEPSSGTSESPTPTAPPATTPEPAEPTVAPTREPTEPTAEAPTGEPQPTAAAPTAAAPEPTAEEALAAYAAEKANGPGAIFVGDPMQLVGLPPHEGLMFEFPPELYAQVATLALVGSPELRVPGHMFVFTSDYYGHLIEKAKLINPTELVSSDEIIEIQHVCIDRQLPPCVLLQTYLIPNLAERTNGQVKISVTSLAELGIAGPDTLTQVRDGTLDMVNIFTGYVAGEVPSLEVQSLWGSAPDWETSYLSLTDLADDVDRLIGDATGGGSVLNRNWFAGSDQWMYSSDPLQTVEDYRGLEIRTNSSAMSDFISGMGGSPVFYSIGELYTALQQGIVDAAAYGALLAAPAGLHEVTDHMSGPIIGFGYTNNVINRDVWDRIPADLQQIMIEEGARAELEGLRLAPFQNVAAVQINIQLGMNVIPFSEEIYGHIQSVVLPQRVIPGWLNRLGFPEENAEIVDIYNEKSSPYTGIWINEDGTIGQVEITKGPRAGQ